MKTIYRFCLVCCLLCAAPYLRATGILQLSAGANQAQTTMCHPYTMIATADINDQIATTTIREKFRQSSFDSATVTFGLPMREASNLSAIRLWIDGVEYETKMQGAARDTSKASGGNTGTTPKTAIQSFFDAYGYTQTAFQFPVTTKIKKNSVVEIEVTTIELLTYSSGTSTYSYMLRPLTNNPFYATSNEPDFLISFKLKTSTQISSVANTSYSRITFNTGASSSEASLNLKSLGAINGDLNIQYSLLLSEVNSAFYSNKPGNEDGHFVFLLRPSTFDNAANAIPKVFTFVIDVSGSMDGIKLQQAKQAAAYCVTHLNPQDRFNVIAFSSSVGRFMPVPVLANAANISDACTYINVLAAGGGTNLQDAALTSLTQYTDTNTVNIVIFLTDGIASLDQTLVASKNTKHVRICVFGVGRDVNSQQLGSLASLNNGIAEFISEATNTLSTISDFYDRVRYPQWRNLSMSITPSDVYDVLPTTLPDLNMGQQLCIAGRYKTPGAGVIHVNASNGAGIVSKDFPVVFTGDSTLNTFCPKIWARQRINYLLDLMNKEGSQTARWAEWRSEIIRLGLRYGLVTQFTTYKDTGTISDVENEQSIAASADVYPNPCSTEATLHFNVEGEQLVWVTLFDINGQEVMRLKYAELMSGVQNLKWDIRDSSGHLVPAGVYICSIRIGDKEQLLKLTIVR